MPTIVSPNPAIHAREKWLLRDDKRPHVNATPHIMVVALGVRFGASPWDRERGFGSRVVAYCKGAQGHQRQRSIPEHCFPINFDGYKFVDKDGKDVSEYHMVYFMPDGQIFASLAEADVETAEKAAA